MGLAQWVKHKVYVFFVASQGGQHPQREPMFSPCKFLIIYRLFDSPMSFTYRPFFSSAGSAEAFQVWKNENLFLKKRAFSLVLARRTKI